MKKMNGKTLQLERELGGLYDGRGARGFRAACDRFLKKRGIFEEGGMNRKRTAEIREAMARKEDLAQTPPA